MGKTFFDNTVMKKLKNHEPVCGCWSQGSSHVNAEIMAEAGFDLMIIDMEHSQLSLQDTVHIIQTTKGTGCAPFVRTPWNDMVWIKQALDTGAYGIHVPYVSTRKEAEYAVKCCKYAPQGVRGIAGSQRATNFSLSKADYYARANEDVIVMIAIETPEGVGNIREIASVEGVDGIFIGPADLSTSMGYIANTSVPEVQAAIREIEEGTKECGKFLATIASSAKAAKPLYDRGYTMVALLSDTTGLAKLAVDAVDYFKNEIRGC